MDLFNTIKLIWQICCQQKCVPIVCVCLCVLYMLYQFCYRIVLSVAAVVPVCLQPCCTYLYIFTCKFSVTLLWRNNEERCNCSIISMPDMPVTNSAVHVTSILHVDCRHDRSSVWCDWQSNAVRGWDSVYSQRNSQLPECRCQRSVELGIVNTDSQASYRHTHHTCYCNSHFKG